MYSLWSGWLLGDLRVGVRGLSYVFVVVEVTSRRS